MTDPHGWTPIHSPPPERRWWRIVAMTLLMAGVAAWVWTSDWRWAVTGLALAIVAAMFDAHRTIRDSS